MKKHYLLAAMLLSTMLVYAGDLTINRGGRGSSDGGFGFFAGEFGVGIPTGTYAKSDTLPRNDTTHTNGWAQTGFHFNGIMGYIFSGGNLGVTLEIGGTFNSFNKTSFNNDVFGSQSTSYTPMISKNYTYITVLIGPFYSINVSDELHIDLHLKIGYASISEATVNESYTNNITSGTFSYSNNGLSGFAYEPSVGLRYDYNPYGAISFSAAYNGMTSTSTIVSVANENSVYSYSTSRTQAMTAGQLSFSIGLIRYLKG